MSFSFVLILVLGTLSFTISSMYSFICLSSSACSSGDNFSSSCFAHSSNLAISLALLVVSSKLSVEYDRINHIHRYNDHHESNETILVDDTNRLI